MVHMDLVVENITAQIHRRIKQKLMLGEYETGATLALRPLVLELGVSQTPVREALLQLVAQGILNAARAQSVRVPAPSKGELKELCAIRLNLELMATRAAVPIIEDATIDEMERLQARLMAARAAGNRSGMMDANFHYHFALYKASRMESLVKILEMLWARTSPALRHLYSGTFFSDAPNHPHMLLVKALRGRDIDAAVAAVSMDVVAHEAATEPA